ncbi:MAG: hypothetical protein M3306_30000, partial [Actinomycetota bacterium]|nr:hypothetical protein [Actinomycetota bacterium]
RRRLEIYAAQTAPLVLAYGDRGLLHRIDGTGPFDLVGRRVRVALGLGTVPPRRPLKDATEITK